jgi:O-antigen/teichoic acid export membrane protein
MPGLALASCQPMRSARKSLVDLTLVMAGKFTSLVVLFLGGVLIARTAGPLEYGVFAVAMTLVLLGDGMIGAPLDLAAVRFFALHPGERDRTERFEAMTLQLKLILGTFAFAAALSMRSLLELRWPALAAQDFPLSSCFLALLALLAARSTATTLQNRQRFRLYSIVDLAQGTARAVGFLLLTWLQLARAAPYVLTYGLAAFGAALAGWLALQQRHLLRRWPTRSDSVLMLRYCGYTAGILTLGTITGRGDLLLLASVKGASGSAAYGLASQIALLLAQAAMYASILTQPRLLMLHRQERIRGLFTINFIAVVCFSLLTLLLWSPAAITNGLAIVFGEGFASSVPILRILLVGVFLDWLIVPVLMVFCIQVCPRKVFLGEILIATLFLALGTAAIAQTWPWPPEQMLAWIAVLGRAAKLLLYGGLFLAHTTPQKTVLPLAASPSAQK